MDDFQIIQGGRFFCMDMGSPYAGACQGEQHDQGQNQRGNSFSYVHFSHHFLLQSLKIKILVYIFTAFRQYLKNGG
jgi:hypothetical protein